MATIVRVKRRRNEGPLDSLVIACKKPKQDQTSEKDDEANDGVKSVFTFAGTVLKKNEPVSLHIKEAIRKKKLQKEYKQHSQDFLDAARRRQKDVNKSNRFKITAGQRSLDLSHLDSVDDQRSADQNTGSDKNNTGSEGKDAGKAAGSEEGGQKCFQIYDLEEEGLPDGQTGVETSIVACNGVPMIREKVAQKGSPQDTDFVYDIYFSNCSDFDFRNLENLLTVEAYGEEYAYEDYRESMDREIYEDEDDSNEEDNWRNDYPDQDPDGEGDYGFDSDGEPISRRLASGLTLGDEELSSDEEDAVCFGQQLYTSSWTPQSGYENYRTKITPELNRTEYDVDYDIDEIDEYS